MNLDRIYSVYGVQEWLHFRGIPEEELALKKDQPNPPGVYFDGTYDWVAGFARFVQPVTILEIGVYRGYSLAAFLKGAEGSVEKVIGIDDCSGAGADTPKAINDLRKEFPLVKFNFFELNSRGFDVTDRGILLSLGRFDLIHIDGDHSYEGAKSDLDNFGPLVSDKGIITVHDTVDPHVKQAAYEFIHAHNMAYREIPTSNGNIVMCRKSE